MNTVNNPEIDRLIDSGEFLLALQQPIRRAEVEGHNLESILLGPTLSENTKEDLAYAGITLGDFLYDYIRIDPTVIEGVDFARHEDLHNFLSFAYFAECHQDLAGRSSIGFIANLEGYVAERVAAQHLQAAGHDVSFPDAPNQEGFDILVDGQPFQVKCLADAAGVNEHLARFDYPVIVNAELADQVGHLDNVYVDSALHHDTVVQATENSLHHGAALTDFEIPWISLAVSTVAPGYRLFRGDTDFTGFATAVASNTAGRTIFGFAGSKSASIACLALFGPAGGVVGAGVGAILGAGVGRRVAAAARGMFTREEEEEVNRARIELIEQAVEAASPKRSAWHQKGTELELSLRGPGVSRHQLQSYITKVHQEEMSYQQGRLSDLERLRINGDGLNAVEFSRQALILVKRAGIHPHFIQRAMNRLLRALETLGKARTRWLAKSTR